MKIYKQILEAINKGIQLALDDFNDEEQVQNVKSKQIQNRDYTKEYLDLMKDNVVDLGLPSRTLWYEYNLGVDPNQLSPKDRLLSQVACCGDYYAWAELTPKRKTIKANWDTYSLSDQFGNLYKYCTDPSTGVNGFTDNLTQLLPEDDAAAQLQVKKPYGFKIHIPTKDQCEELITYTTSNVVESNFNLNMLELTSIINGNKLYFPFSGATYSEGFYNYNTTLLIPSSQLENSRQFYCIKADIFNRKPVLWSTNRCYLLNIRPVVNL